MEFAILSIRQLDGEFWGIDAVSAYGRRTSAVLAFWQTTAEGIQAALERSYGFQLDADELRAAALLSIAADLQDPPEP